MQHLILYLFVQLVIFLNIIIGENNYQIMFDMSKTENCTKGVDCGSRNF